MEDHEVTVPFRGLIMVDHKVNAACTGKKTGKTVRTAVRDFEAGQTQTSEKLMNPKKIICRPFTVIAAAALLAAAMPASGFCTDFEVYGKIEHFRWKEYDGGSELLEESGPVYSVGGIADFPLAEPVSVKLRGELFGGSVDYDGETQPPESYPVTTDTDYLGAKLEADLGWDITVTEKLTLTPFAGIGARLWERDIQSALFLDESTQTVKIARGVTEQWRNYYTRAGLSGNRSFAGQWTGFFKAGFKIPVYTENVVESTVLEPGNRLSGFAELGLESGMFKITLFYEGLRFSKSDRVYFYDGTNYGYMYQPESEADIFGISAGIAF
ncbi:MAG: hypothetical protein ACOCP6_02120 [Desulfosalsimonas sp.]